MGCGVNKPFRNYNIDKIKSIFVVKSKEFAKFKYIEQNGNIIFISHDKYVKDDLNSLSIQASKTRKDELICRMETTER